MTRKIYRTAQGKQVDLGALQLQNENVRAVGNMNVNARGDIVDHFNRPIETKNNTVKRSYDRQIGNVRDQPVTKQPHESTGKKIKPARPDQDKRSDSRRAAASTPQNSTDKASPVSAAPPEPTDSLSATDKPSTGIAAAIARARIIREQPASTTDDLVKKRPGVSRI